MAADAKDLAAGIYRRLFWRPHEAPPNPQILVMIPLVGPENSSDWARDCAILSDTLASLEKQRYRNFQVILSCQKAPPGFEGAPNHHFVEAPLHHGPGNVSDQRIKMRLMVAYAARMFSGFCYVMHLDADDLLHPGLFEYVASDNNGTGYLVEEGYMVDARSGRIATLSGGQGGAVPFWQHCGSCALFAVDWTAQRFPATFFRLIGKGHKAYAARSARLGYPLRPLPFASMLYVVNHGNNMQIRKGNNKLTYLERHEITDDAEIAAIKQAFAVASLALAG